ncbi:MAG: hypothetical protein CL484_07625, partial [Acidobacteria bacterium]|nr:hypothetical protein [Acidobacteriota bacterium]
MVEMGIQDRRHCARGNDCGRVGKAIMALRKAGDNLVDFMRSQLTDKALGMVLVIGITLALLADNQRPIDNIWGQFSDIDYMDKRLTFLWTGRQNRSCDGVITPRYQNNVVQTLESRVVVPRAGFEPGGQFFLTVNRPWPHEAMGFTEWPKYVVRLQYRCKFV